MTLSKQSDMKIAVLLVALAGYSTELLAETSRGLQDNYNEVLRSLSCRTEQISVGQSNAGAIILDELDQKYLYQSFYIKSDTNPSRIAVALSPAIESDGSPELVQPHWTAHNDMMVDLLWEVLEFPPPSATSNLHMPVATRVGGALNANDEDAFPVQVPVSMILTGTRGNRELLKFDTRTHLISGTGIQIGPYNFIVDSDNDVVRFVQRSSSPGLKFERYEVAQSRWVPLSVPQYHQAIVVHSTKLLFLRKDHGVFEVAMLVHGEGQQLDRLVLLREHASRPYVLAQGNIDRVQFSAYEGDIYGYFAVDGTFVPIANNQRTEKINAWLKQFSKMGGLLDFGFLEEGGVVVVKRQVGSDAPDIEVLSYSNVSPSVLYESCAHVTRGIEKIVSSGQDTLFLSQNGDAHAQQLILYLHDGPMNRVGAGGSWVSDTFALAGYNVLVVNYSGSEGNSFDQRRPENLQEVFGNDIERGITFAERVVAHKRLKLVVVADGFGSLVGLAAVAAGRISPTKFIDIGGVVRPGSLAQSMPAASVNAYVQRTIRDLNISPQRLDAQARSTRYLFIHGEDDVTAPREDVVELVEKLNSLRPSKPAQLDTIPNTYHELWSRSQYRAVLSAIDRFMAH